MSNFNMTNMNISTKLNNQFKDVMPNDMLKIKVC
jgi:hypothetical protein